ncbi:hypothetical protein GCM10027398_14610 [Azotobacter salinestris]
MSHQGSNVTAFSEQLARWAQGVQFNNLPAEALEFDETHNRSLVHMSSPAAAATLVIVSHYARQVA